MSSKARYDVSKLARKPWPAMELYSSLLNQTYMPGYREAVREACMHLGTAFRMNTVSS
jgi:hypothetical protein